MLDIIQHVCYNISTRYVVAYQKNIYTMQAIERGEKMRKIYIKKNSIIYYIILIIILTTGLASFITIASESESIKILIASKIISMLVITVDIIMYKKFSRIVK